MQKKAPLFIWSDNWWVENNIAWFVDGEYNGLFQMNLRTNECIFLVHLPSSENKRFRVNPRCIKCGNEIYCMPDMGDCIWVCNLDTLQLQQIVINNPNNERLLIANFWRYDEKIFAVSVGLRQVIEINILKKRVDSYYDLTKIPEERISLSVLVDNSIYSVSAVSSQIYEFNLATKLTIIYSIPNIKSGLHTICFDGENFWLSGYRKEIYVWNKEKNTVKVLNKFPQNFGIYNFNGEGKQLLDCCCDVYNTPTFADAIVLRGNIWFIPFQTNKVLYVSKSTFEIKTLEIGEENETEETLLENKMNHKYLLEYISENGEIGLFSLKNNCILEIDSSRKEVERKVYIFGNECQYNLVSLLDMHGQVIMEESIIGKKVYMAKLFIDDIEMYNHIQGNVGNIIYKNLC